MKQFSIVAILLLLSFSTIHAQDYSTIRAKERREKDRRNDFPRFRFALQGGWSYRTAKVADLGSAELEEYAKGLKSGFHLGADAAYFFAENYGCGLKYSYFHAGNEIANVTVTTNTGEVKTGLMKDGVNIHYIAPSFYVRYFLADDKLVFLGGASIGYLRYIDNAVLVDKFAITGGTVGAGLELGLDYMITEHFGVGANVGLVSGVLTKYTIDDGINQTEVELEKEQRESLARLDLSVGVRWSF